MPVSRSFQRDWPALGARAFPRRAGAFTHLRVAVRNRWRAGEL
jgi:hypothetical protein